MNVYEIVAIIVGTGVLAAAIMNIWDLSKRIKTRNETTIETVVDKVLEKYDEKVKARLENKVEKHNNAILQEFKLLEKQITEHFAQQAELHRENDLSIRLLKDSVLEAYKRSIRDIYYRLSKTGEISDVDKAYIDKIFPKYILMGGNSDIEAKYEEIKGVFSKLTQEKFASARAKALAEQGEDGGE
jgi:hypothetical protein